MVIERRAPAGPELTAGQARRIAIAAQQLAGPPRIGPVNRGHVRRLINQIGLLQIDSVNVLARAHLMPVFSRLGPYQVSVLEQAAWPSRPANRTLFEAWAHQASLVPIELYPLLRWRREKQIDGPWASGAQLRRNHPGFIEDVVGVFTDSGPKSAGEIEAILERAGSGGPGWWGWSETKIACEYLFAIGTIGTAFRRGFERVYDLAERVVPVEILRAPAVAEVDAKRELVERSLRAHGIGTVGDIADYYRLRNDDTKKALLDLVEAGSAQRVGVHGWREPAFLHTEARIPRKASGRALLCPFDPLIFGRARTERLFGFRYRVEIYTPEPRRIYGYYVFPLLVGERLVGRFDLKADRLSGRLMVQSAWFEPGEEPEEVALEALPQLARMAEWLSLESIVVAERGNLWSTLRPRPAQQVWGSGRLGEAHLVGARAGHADAAAPAGPAQTRSGRR